MMEPENQAYLLLKDAFKRQLQSFVGNIESMPAYEAGAWSLALLELASELRSRQLDIEENIASASIQPEIQ